MYSDGSVRIQLQTRVLLSKLTISNYSNLREGSEGFVVDLKMSVVRGILIFVELRVVLLGFR